MLDQEEEADPVAEATEAVEIELSEAPTIPARPPSSKEDFVQPLENMSSATGRKDQPTR